MMAVRVMRTATFAVALAMVGMACQAAWAMEGSRNEWLTTQKLRSEYVYTPNPEATDEELLTTLQDLGFNTLIAYDDGSDFASVQKVIEAAAKHGMHFFSSGIFRSGPQVDLVLEKGTRHYVDENGVEAAKGGCPLDARLWEVTFFDRNLPLVEYSRDHPLVAGYIADIENYGGNGPFNILDFCYCEGCLTDFFKARGMNEDAKAIPAPERKKWLESKGLLDTYKEWEMQQVEKACRSQREKIDAINPDFILAALINNMFERDPFSWAMAKGFATERAPIILMPEHTYGGFKVTIPWFYEEAEKRGVPMLLVPGFWPRQHMPMKLITHFYLDATLADGYWLWYGQTSLKELLVWREPGTPLPVPYAGPRVNISGTPAQWRRAFSVLNQELTCRLADPTYQPRLFPTDPRLPREMTPLKMKSVQSSEGVSIRPQSWEKFFDAPWKGSQVLVEADGAGESVTFEVEARLPADRYQLHLFLSKSADHGIVQTYLNGKKIGEPIDCYASRRFVTDQLRLGDIMPLEGQVRLTFRIMGKNPRSSGYNFGVAGYRLQTFADFATDWMLLGPFPNPDDKGLDIDYLNGWQPDGQPGLTYTDKDNQQIEWKRTGTQPDRYGYLNLQQSFTNNVDSVAYAYTWVKSPKTSLRRIWVGSDDGLRMWVDGKEVLYSHIHRGASPDYTYVDLELKEGWTPILMKVDQGTGDWGLYLRISDPRGELKYSAARD